MSLRDELKAKSQKAVEHMGAAPKGADAKTAAAGKPVTAVGAVAFMQPTIDALNERVKNAEAANEELRRKVDAQPTEVELGLLDEKPGRKRRLTPDQFEELKENLRKYKTTPLRDIIDLSENERLSRTIITGTTALLALGGTMVFGGPVLFPLVFTMVFGIIIGTYSSIYIALPLILVWGVKRGDDEATPIKFGAASRP